MRQASRMPRIQTYDVASNNEVLISLPEQHG